jgi:immune inhibitor A
VLPRPAADYTGSENGVHVDGLNARTMADDALTALDAGVDLGPYDNDHNGFVDAYVVVHSGRGAEESGAPTDVWSHKWVLPEPRRRGGVSVFGYLTIPEDAKLGVCAHELGHLLFGWPDLYDDDASSRGVGDFCLMAAGSCVEQGHPGVGSGERPDPQPLGHTGTHDAGRAHPPALAGRPTRRRVLPRRAP